MTRRNCVVASLVVLGACAASSCSQSPNNPSDVADINASVGRLTAAVNAKDLNGIMAYYVPDDTLLVFDAVLPRQYSGAAAFRKDWEGFLTAYPSTVHAEVTDLKVETDGNLGYSHCVFRTVGPDKDGKPLDMTVRVTDIYKKVNGKWLCAHEHVSWPVDLATGKADMMSKP